MTNTLVQATQSNRIGKFAQAVREHRAVIEVDPENALAFQGLGYALLRLGEYDEAIATYQRAIQLEPKLAISHADLGCIYQSRQQYAESEMEFRHAIELDPELSEAYMNLGFVLAAQKHLDEAESILRRAIELDPERSIAHQNLSAIYVQRGRFSDAISEASHAFSLAPSLSTFGLIISTLLRQYRLVATILITIIVLIAFTGRSLVGLLIGVAFIAWMIWSGVHSIRSRQWRQAGIFMLIALFLFTLYIYQQFH